MWLDGGTCEGFKPIFEWLLVARLGLPSCLIVFGNFSSTLSNKNKRVKESLKTSASSQLSNQVAASSKNLKEQK
jgi:hypothetical protein